MAVLTQVSIRDLFQEPVCVEAALRVMQEAAAVANALGAQARRRTMTKRIAHGRSLDHKPSILQDLELGRPMEIDGIFDAPLELARMAGVATPTLDLLVAMAKVRARAAGLYPLTGGHDHGNAEFGRTGLQVSILGFGCGAVGGLMVRGTPADQERAVARALEAGINYFDTAAHVRQRRVGEEPRPRAGEAEARTSSSAPRCASRRPSSAASPRRSPSRWRPACSAWAASRSTSSTCTTRSR